jgi:hypothetical protein
MNTIHKITNNRFGAAFLLLGMFLWAVFLGVATLETAASGRYGMIVPVVFGTMTLVTMLELHFVANTMRVLDFVLGRSN